MGKGDCDFFMWEQAGIVRMICLDMPGGAEASFAFMKPGGCVTLGWLTRRMMQVKNEVNKTCGSKV